MQQFKESFCRYFECSPERYLREALRRTLHPRAARLGFLALLLCSPLNERVLEEAGDARDMDELRDAIRHYECDVRLHGGLWTRRWKFRVSGRRLLELYVTVREQEARESPAPPSGLA